MNKRHHDYDAVCDYIVEYKIAHDGLSPTLREIMDNCSISSTSVVSYILTQLEQDNKIILKDKKSRSIMIPGGSWHPPASPPMDYCSLCLEPWGCNCVGTEMFCGKCNCEKVIDCECEDQVT